jgi:hypothetical protein
MAKGSLQHGNDDSKQRAFQLQPSSPREDAAPSVMKD